MADEEPTSVTSIAEVRSIVATGLSDELLQSVIDREEAALARVIGPLIGERTQTFYVGERPLYVDVLTDTSAVWFLSERMGGLTLQRPTDEVAVTDNGTLLDDDDVRLLRSGTRVERASGGWTGPIVEAEYTPNDELEIKRVVIALVGLALVDPGMTSETLGDYQYSRSPVEATGRALIRSLQTHQPQGTMRVRSSSDDDRVGAFR